MYRYQCPSFFVAKPEDKELKGIFFLKNQIGLISASGFNYTNLIFKIENKKVTTAYNVTSETEEIINGYPVVYDTATEQAVNIGKTWTPYKTNLTRFLNELSEQFIEIIYGLYGREIEYQSSNETIWSIYGKVENIQGIGYEAKNSIRMRRATYNK